MGPAQYSILHSRVTYSTVQYSTPNRSGWRAALVWSDGVLYPYEPLYGVLYGVTVLRIYVWFSMRPARLVKVQCESAVRNLTELLIGGASTSIFRNGCLAISRNSEMTVS